MNIFELEKLGQELNEELKTASSEKQCFFLIYNFYTKIIGLNPSVANPFLLEFLDKFILYSKNFSPLYCDLSITNNILSIFHKLSSQIHEYKLELDNNASHLKQKTDLLISFLKGELESDHILTGILFPVLEEHSEELSNFSIGMLEEITIHIRKGKNQNNFIIVPSGKKVEEKLSEQIKISWQLAVNVISKYKKHIHAFHEVIIMFNRREGNYSGNSLGISLVTGFIEQLFLFYNTPYKIEAKNNIAATGGIDKNGIINSLPEAILAEKIDIVFFSYIKIFVVPADNLLFAKQKLSQLKERYPKRYLKLIGAEDLDNLLNQRNIISMEKAGVIKRVTKFTRHNKLAVFLLFIIAIAFSVVFMFLSDDNPASFSRDSNNVYILNKSGRVLFARSVHWRQYVEKDCVLIHDINSDGKNEVLFCNEDENHLENKEEYGRIICVDNTGNLIWKYLFKDSVECIGEKIPPYYSSRIIDIIEENNSPVLYCLARNNNTFTSPVFRLDAKTGHRLPGLLWNPGHIIFGIFWDVNQDGKKDLVLSGSNNAFELPFIMAVDRSNLLGETPARGKYKLIGVPPANLIQYILIPKSDYTLYQNVYRTGAPGTLRYSDYEKTINLGIGEIFGSDNDVTYKFSLNLKSCSLLVGNTYKIKRDSLVSAGILDYPLTDTDAYCKLMTDQVVFWNGERFVKLNENSQSFFRE